MPSPANFGCKGQKGSAAAKSSADLVTSKCYTTIHVAERVQISRNKTVLLCNSVYSASSEMFGVHAVSWERLPCCRPCLNFTNHSRSLLPDPTVRSSVLGRRKRAGTGTNFTFLACTLLSSDCIQIRESNNWS